MREYWQRPGSIVLPNPQQASIAVGVVLRGDTVTKKKWPPTYEVCNVRNFSLDSAISSRPAGSKRGAITEVISGAARDIMLDPRVSVRRRPRWREASLNMAEKNL